MTEIGQHLWLTSALVVCILIIVLAVFIRRSWLKSLAVICGAVALWLPLMALLSALGEASPFAPDGNYRLISSKYIEERELLYLFVDTMGRDATPRIYRIHFEKSKYERLQETASDYDQQVLHIDVGGSGDAEIVYVMYEPPDLLKEGVMRGYRPRQEE